MMVDIGKSAKRSTLPKYPVWAPRPIVKILPGKRPTMMVFEPRSLVTVGFDLVDRRMPLVYLSTKDKSGVFKIENNIPYFEIKTSLGKMKMDVDGVRIENVDGTFRTHTWQQKKEIAHTLAELAMKDKVYRSVVISLANGLKTAASLTRDVSSLTSDAASEKAGNTLPPHLQRAIVFPSICSFPIAGDPVSVIAEILFRPKRIVECTEQAVETSIEACIGRSTDCITKAAQRRQVCLSNCSGLAALACEALCWTEFSIESAICLGLEGIICAIVKTVEHALICITERGWVPNEPPRDGDVLLFEKQDTIGAFIDSVTCGYGYSHSALVCGGNMIHATPDGVICTPLDYYDTPVGPRKFAVIRLGLSDSEVQALCACVNEKIGADYDYLEAISFGTIDDPGREICTMLIMNCLDTVRPGYREELGLGGFVSANEIARQLGAPSAQNL